MACNEKDIENLSNYRYFDTPRIELRHLPTSAFQRYNP
jgi:hypothetical protein